MPRKKTIGRSPADLIEPDASLEDLRHAVQLCRGCDIWQRATQAVFGEGAPDAEVMSVGEQPGSREDREGHPFVGPAGKRGIVKRCGSRRSRAIEGGPAVRTLAYP